MDSKKSKPPQNIKETKIWQQTVGAVQQMLAAWLNMLRVSFLRMGRADQQKLITNFSQIITIGVSCLALSFVYQFLPLLVRVLLLPTVIVAAWWVGSKVVPQVIIKRFGSFFNPN
jgi:hypothetical protein